MGITVIPAEDFSQTKAEDRIQALERQMELFSSGKYPKPNQEDFVNNHIHTIYSFSPYSPVSAAYTAWLNGLTTAGIMDHDSVAGAEEFIRAGELIGIATTVGFECRCKMDNTPFAGRRINNPDQKSVVYVACHGIPHQNIQKAQQWLAPVREKRNIRNKKIVDNINSLFKAGGIKLDFEKDVLVLSQFINGGGVTERHILYALAFAITAKCGKGRPVLDFLKQYAGVEVTGKNQELLQDSATGLYEYTLLGVLKSSLVEKIYVDADEECPDISEFISFVHSIGAIPAYAYLGDVGDSITGDKKSQKFEDDFLDELVPWLAKAGFLALTYMPTRNTKQQLERVMTLCEENDLFQISGEDINSPSQSFICKALEKPEFKHLITATWALIGHEISATQDINKGMFSGETIRQYPNLDQRINHYAKIGKNII